MNPFDLPGPAFLIFYVALAAVLLVMVDGLRRGAEGGAPPLMEFGDPYHVALLRADAGEGLRMGVLTLIHRGLLRVDGNDLALADGVVAENATRPLERAVLQHFSTRREALSIVDDAVALSVCRDYERRLEQLRLLPDVEVRAARWQRFLGASGVLVGVTALKLVLAYERGRPNVGLLLLATLFAVIAVYRVTHPRRTERGTRLLRDLQALCAVPQARANASTDTGDLSLLAAIFGAAMLPDAIRAHASRLYPKATGSGGGSNYGASCGSSCGSGCGSGGGCGGCGS